MRLSIAAFLDYRLWAPADLLLALEVAPTEDQTLVSERLVGEGLGALTSVGGEDGVGRRIWTHATGRFTAHYSAIVDIARTPVNLAGLPLSSKAELPGAVIRYLWPSRYCDSDRFEAFVAREFGDAHGGDKVLAIAEWVARNVAYEPGISNNRTTAGDTFLQRQGVCRDLSHLMIAMVRAADIPARMVGAYGWQVSPPDFHAVAEVWLNGGWHLVDASGLADSTGILRIGVGRDATDISFLTIFGRGDLMDQHVTVSRLGPSPLR